ncbi:hypothetical protein Aca07nite_25880 [Actinoplanes capillaceus]|uniref:Anti-sigma-K factor rskA n=2 Tax=Actinoplanes campanulatus TaxID=113559 RepID=A0ABQ3WGF9_9ACTN|nr:hypothetical protein Aca07nite_25880 [Actinoplanes capillaceus]
MSGSAVASGSVSDGAVASTVVLSGVQLDRSALSGSAARRTGPGDSGVRPRVASGVRARRPTLAELAETQVMSSEAITARITASRMGGEGSVGAFPRADSGVTAMRRARPGVRGTESLAAVRERSALAASRLLSATGNVAALGWAARKRPALSVTFAAAGLGAVVASVFGLAPERAEFRPPPASGMRAPTTAKASVDAAHVGIAPYAPTSAAAGDQVTPGTRSSRARNGRSSARPSSDSGTSADSLVSADPATPTPRGARARDVTGPAGSGTPETASIRLGQPSDGGTLSTGTSITGSADLPADHQIWLLWRQGAGSYHVGGACRGGRTFTCDPPGLENGGDDTFQLTVVVVDPDTGRTLHAGETRDALPSHLARHDITITVRRAAG